MQPIIRVENLSKQYRIGASRAPYATLRESLATAATAPFRRIRNLTNGNGAGAQSGIRNPQSNLIWALKDVSFEVMPGEVVGVIGRNGAGKSTLLKILSRITEPTSGGVDLYGQVGSLLEVGTGFHPELTGRENIYLSGAILGIRRSEISQKFCEIVSFGEVGKFIDTPVKHYSSGMYLRLAFAVAAHLEPEILLIDEVLAVGDSEFQKKCLGKMEQVAKEGRTVLFVSHQMAAVQQLCTRAFLIRSGVLCEQGPTDAVLGNYFNDALRSADGTFDFSTHPGRSPKHDPIIRHLRLLSANGSSTTSYYPNDSFTVELTIEPTQPIREPRLAVAIEDSLGRRIMTLASYFQERGVESINAPCRIRCTLPCLTLGSGRYLISVSVGDAYCGLLDSLDNAAWFDVGWRNNYRNGEPYHPIYGPILTQSIWEQVD